MVFVAFARAFSGLSKQGPLFVVVAEPRPWAHRLQRSCLTDSWLEHTGSVVVAPGLSCSAAWGILPGQGSVVVAPGLSCSAGWGILPGQGSVVVAHGLSCSAAWGILPGQGSVVVAHGFSCSAAWGVFPGQGSNPCTRIGRVLIHCATRKSKIKTLHVRYDSRKWRYLCI